MATARKPLKGGNITSIAPPSGARPSPPRKPVNMERQCPSTRAKQGSASHRPGTSIRRAATMAIAPFAISPMRTCPPGTLPTCRRTLDAPGKPVPTLKMSTPRLRLIHAAIGNAPSRYAISVETIIAAVSPKSMSSPMYIRLALCCAVSLPSYACLMFVLRLPRTRTPFRRRARLPAGRRSRRLRCPVWTSPRS